MEHVGPWIAGLVAVLLIAASFAHAFSARRRQRRDNAARDRTERMLRLQSAAMESAANSIFITDHRGHIEWSNAAFERLTGWNRAEAMGQSAQHLLMPGGIPGDLARSLRDHLALGQPWRGEMELFRKNGEIFVVDQTVTAVAQDKSGTVSHYVVVQEDITERRRADERIRFLSSYDALTMLPNRLLFREQVNRCIARTQGENGTIAVLFLDLLRFSHYNDVLGHDAGDRLLVRLVDRLLRVAKPAEAVARVGGDEFALLFEGGTARSAARLADEILAAVTQPLEHDGHLVRVGASMGITLYPSDGADAATLMKNADTAMYRAMRECPGGYRFFSPAMDAELAARRRLESDLGRAVADGTFELYYQPIVAIASRRIIGLEALIRWRRGAGRIIGPDSFIPIAEDNGMIAGIGEWVLAEACRQSYEWAAKGVAVVPISVNVSAVQMRRRNLPRLISQALELSGIPPDRLVIELTESAVVADSVNAERILAEIKALGVGLAMDDFGIGYSSLARLKQFPMDKLKLDRSFVTDLLTSRQDAAIARAVVALGHGLGLQVISEGVETEAQLRYLEGEGVDAIQGYLFSPPVAVAEAEALLRRGVFPNDA